MKRTFKNLSTGILAAAFGLALVFTGSAFKASKLNRVQYTFRYNDANHSKANVEDESKWVYAPTAAGCDEIQQRACTILVDQAYVNPGSTPTLKTSLNLSATSFDANNAFVSNSADGNMEIQNSSIE